MKSVYKEVYRQPCGAECNRVGNALYMHNEHRSWYVYTKVWNNVCGYGFVLLDLEDNYDL
jgi:hypothetical protein